ncbi:MAG TPA: hypothetical protein DDZ51_06835 [Planctomycetaceae bacterium]|nr:hypothetical protein [Planctomycetaceae bacterium]
MTPSIDHEELYFLFGQMVDGIITPAEHERLEAILAKNSSARQLWFQFVDIDAGLADWTALKQHQTQQDVPRLTIQSTQNARRIPQTIQWAIACAAAVVVIAAWFWARSTVEISSQGVAVLSRSVNAVWNHDSTAKANTPMRTVGAVLTAEKLNLVSGAVLLEFYNGARVILEGPVEASLVSVSELTLHSGRIHAHVPPQASGFSVQTPQFRLIDHGTDFGVYVAATEAEVHVFKGKVELKSNQATQPTRFLESGDGLARQTSEKDWKEIPTNDTAFLNETQLARREALGAETQRTKWLEASRDLSEDVDTVVHYRFDDPDPQQNTIINQVVGSPDGTQGRTVGCEWTLGRWPQKQAVQFRGEGDRIRLRVENPLPEVTLIAWVRVHDLRQGLQSLLSADDDVPGSLHWELSHQGELRLAIARDLGRTKADWEAVNSSRFVTPERYGQWLMLVTTFDGTTVKHYGNGELIGSGASFQPPAMRIGPADIGNSNGSNLRNLSGAMDEFAIIARVLSANEIRDLYVAGKP